MNKIPYVSLPLGADGPGRRTTAAHIVSVVEREARCGGLPPGSRMPPVRVLAHQLGISKNTVQTAIDELVARGLLEGRRRSGVFMVEVPISVNGHASKLKTPLTPAAARLMASPNAHLVQPAGKTPLSHVFIDPELLPKENLARCLRGLLSGNKLETYYDPMGYPPLREAISERLKRHGIDAGPDEILITGGSQQALDLVSRLLRRRCLATESPAYAIGKSLFAINGLRVVGLPVDPFRGIDLASWERRIKTERPGLLYVVSRFQNPTGYSYSSAELQALLEMSRRYGFGILEDDWGSDMLSFTDFRPSLRALGGNRVLYANSFTKKILPSLRLGYVVAEPDVLKTLLGAKRVSALGGPVLLEQALHRFLERGYYDAYLRATQAELDRRYHLCLEALRAHMPEGVRWTTPGGGPSLWLELPKRIDLGALRGAMSVRGYDIRPSEEAFFGHAHLHGFRLGYAFLSPKILERGIETLAREVRRHL